MLVLRDGRISELVLDVVHLGFDVEERLKSTARLFEHRAARVSEAVLWQVANRKAGWFGNRARVGLLQSSQDLEQRRLSGAVGTAQTDTLTVSDLPRHVIEQDAVAERLREIGELDHADRTPNAFAAAASTWVVPNGFVR